MYTTLLIIYFQYSHLALAKPSKKVVEHNIPTNDDLSDDDLYDAYNVEEKIPNDVDKNILKEIESDISPKILRGRTKKNIANLPEEKTSKFWQTIKEINTSELHFGDVNNYRQNLMRAINGILDYLETKFVASHLGSTPNESSDFQDEQTKQQYRKEKIFVYKRYLKNDDNNVVIMGNIDKPFIHFLFQNDLRMATTNNLNESINDNSIINTIKNQEETQKESPIGPNLIRAQDSIRVESSFNDNDNTQEKIHEESPNLVLAQDSIRAEQPNQNKIVSLDTSNTEESKKAENIFDQLLNHNSNIFESIGLGPNSMLESIIEFEPYSIIDSLGENTETNYL